MGGNSPTSVAVMADAQFTAARVLKPFSGFDAIYQGKSTSIPIMLPGDLDPRAGQAGVDPDLIGGLTMSLGARVCVWIPLAIYETSNPSNNYVIRYDYTLHWRMRNVADFRERRIPFHFPRQTPGAPNSNYATGYERVIIPAANEVIIYEPPDPGGSPAVMKVYNQSYRIGDAGGLVQPYTPSGTFGMIQQGVLNPINGAQAAAEPIFTPIWTEALGDELLISCKPSDRQAPADTWDFTDPTKDLPFLNIYGALTGQHESYPDLGIYVMQGTSP